MSADVVYFPGPSRLDTPVGRVMEAAVEASLTEIVVIGFDEDGDFYFASSKADGGDVLWLLERAKHKLMTITDELEEGA
jgi:hypothetical protein